MRQLIGVFLLMGLFYSCKEKTRFQERILLKNETESTFKLTLLPKAEYLNGDLYDFSDIGGGYRNTIIEIAPGIEEELYITQDLKVQPNSLIEKVFMGIQINTTHGNEIELRFSADTVTGYAENMFDENSNWLYVIREFDLPTQFKANPVESHDYIFVISQSNYLDK